LKRRRSSGSNSAAAIYIDEDYNKIVSIVSKAFVQKKLHLAAEQLLNNVGKKCALPLVDSDWICGPEEATKYFEECILVHEKTLLWLAQAFTPFQWLWYLRRLPDHAFLSTDDLGLGLHVAALAEVVSGYGPETHAGEITLGTTEPRFDTSDKALNAVVDLVVAARYLNVMHQMVQHASRGTSFSFKDEHPVFPRALISAEQLKAEELFQSRFNKSTRLDSPLIMRNAGTQLAHLSLDGEIDTSSCIFAVMRCHSHLSKVAIRVQHGGYVADGVQVFQRYLPCPVSLKRLIELQTMNASVVKDWWSPDAPALLQLMRLAPAWMDEHYRDVPVRQYGYMRLLRSDLRKWWEVDAEVASQALMEIFPGIPTTFEQFISALQTSGSMRPLKFGPIARSHGQWMIIDLYAATHKLNTSFEFPKRGYMTKEKGDHFENTVQAVIDSSPWRPSNDLRKYITRKDRHLKRADGSSITDVDAIGQKDNTLLLVSVKAFTQSADYDAAKGNAVRNLVDAVHTAIYEARAKQKELSERRTSSNYDFSKFSQILMPVCTLLPIELPIGPGTQEIDPGLYVATSLDELAEWLIRSG